MPPSTERSSLQPLPAPTCPAAGAAAVAARAFLADRVAVIGADCRAFYGDFGLFVEKTRGIRKFVIELVGTVLTGIAAVIAAFELSMPDRPAQVWLPLPPLILWLASSGYNCWRD